jgi:hypothetical protein
MEPDRRSATGPPQPGLEDTMGPTRSTARFLLICVAAGAAWFGLARSADERTLTGTYVWNDGARGDLTAHFAETGENAWDVDFRFKFDGVPHVYSGTARGSLDRGRLEGVVKNESGKRTFVFEGSFRDDGVFRGTHAETTPGRRADTGTLTLGR